MKTPREKRLPTNQAEDRPVSPRTAMVLAAGLGLRMRPLTDSVPKPLLEVAGRPLIDHVLDKLATAGVERAVVNVHRLADVIEQHVTARRRPRGNASATDSRGRNRAACRRKR